jgi:cytochrome c peroxidase
MQEALGNLNTDPDALESVVRVYEDVIRGRVELHNKSVDESVQSGIKMPYSLRIDLPPPRDKIAPPPPEAIAELRANPALKKQFDEVFGAGAADRALKGGR